MNNSVKNTFAIAILACTILIQQPVYAGFFDFLKEPPKREHRHDNRRDHHDRRHDHRDDRRDGHRYDHRDDRRDRRDDRYDRRDDRRDERSHQPSTPKGWRQAGSASAGNASEFSFSGASQCYIEVTSGSVSINTVVVRRGGQKQSVRVVTKFNQGQRFYVPVDGSVSGIRVSTGGKGTYRVYVK